MAVPTIIRADKFGAFIGVVNTTFTPEFTARFQLYAAGDAGDALLLVRESAWDEEAGAVEAWEAWRKEARLLVDLGDM
jgi:hypothetical protein